MSSIDDMRNAMRSAQMFGKGRYFEVGNYDLEADKVFIQKSSRDGKRQFIVEFKILSSTCAAREAGSSVSWIQAPDQVGALGRIKEFLLTLFGVDVAGTKISADLEDQVATIYAALSDDDFRKSQGLEANFLKGKRVRCEAIATTFKTSGKAGVVPKWGVAA